MFRSTLILLFLILATAQSDAQPSTYPLYQVVYGSQNLNPDSVRVDTTTGSPTYGHLFATGYFLVIFNYSVIQLDSVSSDSILVVGLDAIDTSFPTIDSVFEAIQSKYGTITLRKKYPQIGDSAISTSNEFLLSFNTFVDVDSAMSDLKSVPLNRVYFQRPAASSVIPSDLCIVPGTHEWSIMTDADHWWRDDFHLLGWQWGWYKMHCPMAWEITEGRNTAPYVYILDGDEWSCPISDGEMSNFVQINATTSVKKVASLKLQGNHGMDCMSQAIAGINNGYPMVGVIPNGKGIGIGTGDLYGDIDVGGANYGTLQTLQTFADVIYVASGAPSDFDYMINQGTVVLWAAGNWMNGEVTTEGTFGTAYDGKLWPWTNSYYRTGGILNINNSSYPATTNPAHDIPLITVGATTDGAEQTGCTFVGSGFKRGSERFISWTWPEGQEKFDQTTDPTTRAGLKAAAFMDILAPGHEQAAKPAKDGCTDGYHIESGTSLSVPEVASVVGLMKSVNRWLGVPLTSGIPTQGSDVQVMAHTILTYTADKIIDVDRPVSPMATGYPASTSDPVYTSGGFDTRYAGQSWHYDYYNPVTDPTFTNKDVLQMSDGITRSLHRSWAQRNGFGRVNAYRAVANTIPVIGNYEYTSSPLHLGFSAASQNENGAFLMHFGAWKDATDKVLVAGGNIIPNQSPAWLHYNQGKTLINSTSGIPTILTVGDDPLSGDKDILAIDGNLIGDDLANNEITTTSNGKILITGYLQDVSVTSSTHGPVKMDDLIIYSSGASGYSNVTINSSNGATDSSEIYGVVQLQDNGLLNVNGYLTVQPGGEIEMEGNKNFEISSGGHVKMNASSSIVSTSKEVVVDNGATLEISGLLPVNILCEVDVKNGGTLIIDQGADLQLNNFEVEAGGTLQCSPGGRLTLNNRTIDWCYGNFLFNGTIANPCMLTGGVSMCGTVDQTAMVWVKGNALSITAIDQSSISMTYTLDSDVDIEAQDVQKIIPAGAIPGTGAFDNDHFSANSLFSDSWPYISYMLSVVNTVAIEPAFVPSSVSTVWVTNSQFFDEEGVLPTWQHGFSGLDLWNVKISTVQNCYFYNLADGVESNGCPLINYSNNIFGLYTDGVTAGPMLGGIIDNNSSAIYCSNSVTNSTYGGVTDITVPSGIFHDNTFSGNLEYGVAAHTPSTCDLRNNTFKNYAGTTSYGANYGAWAAGAGSTINLMPLATFYDIDLAIDYGKNSFDPGLPVANGSLDLVKGINPNYGFGNKLHGGTINVECGENYFGQHSSYHIYNTDGPSVPFPINVTNNAWDNPPGSVWAVRYKHDGSVVPSGAPLNLSGYPSFISCGPVPGITCFILLPSYQRNETWLTAPASPTLVSAYGIASATLLSDMNTVDVRRDAAIDEMSAASLMGADSGLTYLPMALSDFRTVTLDPLAPPEIKSALWRLKGSIYEMLGEQDSAVSAYDTVLTSYHQYSDSVYAQWGIQLDTIQFDTLAMFDSELYAYHIRVRNDISAMMDTASTDTIGGGGAGKIADGHSVEEMSSLVVTVHPNPASGSVKVCVEDLPGGIPVVVDVVNQMGEPVATLYNATPEAELGLCLSLDCSQLPSGIYYADLQTEGTHHAVKFTVEH